MSSLSRRIADAGFIVFGRARAIAGALVLLALAGCLGGGGSSAPEISQQPRDRSAFETQTGYFDVGAEGTSPLSFQWRRNGVPIAGATGPTYTTPALTAADNGARFSVTISNPQGSVTSAEATLTVLPAPTITTGPASQTVDVGATASFSVIASGTALSYQWRRDDQPIVGANAASYTTPATTAADDGAIYSVDVVNGAGFVTSAPATLTVRGPAAIATPPLSQTVAVGESAIFGVRATGGELSYQWRRGSTDIAGAVQPVYVAPAATLADDGASFSVVVSNARGTATSVAATLTVVAGAASAPPALPATIVASRSSAATESFVYVRRANGAVSSWGYNGDGQRGDGTTSAASDTLGTVTLPSGLTATRVAAGGNHAVALLSNGSVYTWGRNGNGQLGLGDQLTRTSPTQVVLPRPAVSVAAGRDFSLAVLDDGRVFGWGLNGQGQLGLGTRSGGSLTPVAVPGISTARAVAAGNEHALALLADGTVLAWGSNGSGQLGLGDFLVRRAPVATALRGIAEIRAGGDLSAALTTRRVALAWGENGDGQLGRGASFTADLSVPAGVAADVVDAAAADRLLLLVGSDGLVRGAGANEAGSLGDGTTTARNTFTAASGLTGIIGAASGGRSFALALRGDGAVFAWGDNTARQLGNSTLSATGTSTPTQVPNFDAIP
jgi:alpha-tubulin suppressor-like RCC1 family protein